MFNNFFYNRFSQRETNMDFKESIKLNKIFADTYTWMAVGLFITGLVSFVLGNNNFFLRLLFTNPTVTIIFSIVLFIIQIALVVNLSANINKMSKNSAIASFMFYALVTGISFSTLFLAYTKSSIFMTFFITSVMFLIMAVYGFVTKKDLTKFGNIAMMALIGLMVSSLINFFLRSSLIYYIESFIGVILFSGLIAYDSQKIKEMATLDGIISEEKATKISILGALNLYLDFINLFLYLLRFFGNSRD